MNTQKAVRYAFIDSQNLNLGVRNDIKDPNGKTIYHGWKLDFKRFKVYLQDKYNINKSFLFIGRIEGQEKLYNFLESAGYEVIYKQTIMDSRGKIKGNVDAELVLHTMQEFDNYDKAVIVSGDGDFYCLIDFLLNSGKLGKILIPNKYSFSSLLRKYHKYIAYVSDLKEKLEYKNR